MMPSLQNLFFFVFAFFDGLYLRSIHLFHFSLFARPHSCHSFVKILDF